VKRSAHACNDPKAEFDIYYYVINGFIEVHLIENQFAEAIENARAAIAHDSQPLPDDMVSLVETALQAWEGGDVETARAALEQVVLIGKTNGYMQRIFENRGGYDGNRTG
jgi:hypothetical protein